MRRQEIYKESLTHVKSLLKETSIVEGLLRLDEFGFTGALGSYSNGALIQMSDFHSLIHIFKADPAHGENILGSSDNEGYDDNDVIFNGSAVIVRPSIMSCQCRAMPSILIPDDKHG